MKRFMFPSLYPWWRFVSIALILPFLWWDYIGVPVRIGVDFWPFWGS